MSDFSVVLLAAGSGSRMGGKIKKQYLEVSGRPLIYYPLKAFSDSDVTDIILVVSEGDEDYVKKEIVDKYGFGKVSCIVKGGKERCFSVYEGLKEVKNEYVLVHDGARCLISDDIISRAVEATIEYEACEVAVPSVDTVKISDADGFVSITPDRGNVWSIQTPQGFRTSVLRDAYEILFEKGEEAFAGITDDAMVVERAYPDRKIKLVMGSYDNIKVTTPRDISVCESYFADKGVEMPNDDNDGSFDGMPEAYAFVDGSFNAATGVYGYGGFVVNNGIKYTLQGSGDDKEAAVSRNVAGEVSGAVAAVQKAMELGIKELTIYYDYEGIRHWALKTWKRNKKLTQEYEAFMTAAMGSGLKIEFVHVKGHSGIPGNEEADRLAKKAVGIE